MNDLPLYLSCFDTYFWSLMCNCKAEGLYEEFRSYQNLTINVIFRHISQLKKIILFSRVKRYEQKPIFDSVLSYYVGYT